MADVFCYTPGWDAEHVDGSLLNTAYDFALLADEPVQGVADFPLLSTSFCKAATRKLCCHVTP